MKLDGCNYAREHYLLPFPGPGFIGDLNRRGSVLMDVPECSAFSELVALAGAHLDHPEWFAVACALRERVARD